MAQVFEYKRTLTDCTVHTAQYPLAEHFMFMYGKALIELSKIDVILAWRMFGTTVKRKKKCYPPYCCIISHFTSHSECVISSGDFTKLVANFKIAVRFRPNSVGLSCLGGGANVDNVGSKKNKIKNCKKNGKISRFLEN